MARLWLAIVFLPLIISIDIPVRFAVIGDYGNGGQGQSIAVAELIRQHDVDFIVTTGDNDYGFGYDQSVGLLYGEYFPNDFYPSLGNHDSLIEYVTYFGKPKYYSVRRGSVDLFILDSNDPHPVQKQWFKLESKKSGGKWKIAIFHHPPYTSGAAYKGSPEMRWGFEGIHAVFSGHNHNYERIVMGNDHPAYLVVGSGGVGLYGFSDPIDDSKVRYDDLHGALIVESSRSGLDIQFVNIENVVVDRMHISEQ